MLPLGEHLEELRVRCAAFVPTQACEEDVLGGSMCVHIAWHSSNSNGAVVLEELQVVQVPAAGAQPSLARSRCPQGQLLTWHASPSFSGSEALCAQASTLVKA